MTPPLMVVAEAEAFWQDAGVEMTFPRPIRRAIVFSQPVSVVFLSAMHIADIKQWLFQQGRSIEFAVADRPLRACLVAHGGSAFIFVDGQDSEDEQRFSIAHELAHFLLDYQARRRSAVDRFGEQILDVFDGRRIVRTDERIVGILTEIDMRPHIHLMSRIDSYSSADTVMQSEFLADALALELLAPWSDVIDHLALKGIADSLPAISSMLVERYGLPPAIAWRYAMRCGPTPDPTFRLLQHLRSVVLSTTHRNSE